MLRLPSLAAPLLLLSLIPACSSHGVDIPTKLANIGDSISQGFSANGDLGDHPELSWVQGTDPSIDSIYQRYLALNSKLTQGPESVSGAELLGGDHNFANQAALVCAQTVKPDVVFVLLGANDVCNRDQADATQDPTNNMYSVDAFTLAAQQGMDALASCLPERSTVQIEPMPRVDTLYAAGNQKSATCGAIWAVGNICRIVTNEDDAGRRQLIGDRINQYNQALHDQATAYNQGANQKNPRGIEFRSGWQGSLEDGHVNTSLGAVTLTGDDINGTDCFHPTQQTQAKIACSAWASAPDGSGTSASCF